MAKKKQAEKKRAFSFGRMFTILGVAAVVVLVITIAATVVVPALAKGGRVLGLNDSANVLPSNPSKVENPAPPAKPTVMPTTEASMEQAPDPEPTVAVSSDSTDSEQFTLGGSFDIGDYPINGSVSDQEEYVAKVVNCSPEVRIEKIRGENAAFKIDIKDAPSPTRCTMPTGWMATVHLAETTHNDGLILPPTMGQIVLFQARGERFYEWAWTIRLLPLYPEGVCGINTGEQRFAYQEQYTLNVSKPILEKCGAVDLTGVDPSLGDETRAMQKLFGLSLIREGTANSFYASSDNDLVVPNLNGYYYEITDDSGTYFYAGDGSDDWTGVTAVTIYPTKYFTVCTAYLDSGAETSLDVSSCGK